MKMWMMTVTLVATLALATGCDTSKDQQVLELQRQLELMETTNADLEQQLSLAMRDGEDARRRALDVQRLYDQCRSELSAARSRPAPQPIVQSTPAPQPISSGAPAGWTEMGGGKIAMTEVEADILFDSGRATLKKSGVSAINKVASQIRAEFPGRHIWVIGHTDNDPIKKSKWKDNIELSLQRGAAVARALLSQGISDADMVIAGQGDANPKVNNSSRSNKAKNRRVEIFAVDSSVMSG